MFSKNLILGFSVVIIIGAIAYFEGSKAERVGRAPDSEVAARQSSAEKEKQYERAKEISSPDGFINTPPTASGQSAPITIQELIGKKVILVDFWTYSCINCQRTTPYLNAWYEKYRDKGLEIIGIHTPEFEFEKKYENVKRAVQNFGIKYPVVLDNDYSTWTAYKNRYWPRKYLIDIDGFIVYDHIGEGAYEETERKIQEALKERMLVLGIAGGSFEIAASAEAPNPDFGKVGSPEVYFGSSRNTLLSTENQIPAGVGWSTFVEPSDVRINALYLKGWWDLTDEYAENKNAGSKIIFRFKAKSVYFVASAESPVRAKVMLDGKAIGSEAGADVKNGYVEIGEDRLYKLIESSSYGEHTLELIIESPGLKAFTFTFG